MEHPNKRHGETDLTPPIPYPHNELGDKVLAFAVGWFTLDLTYLASPVMGPPPPIGGGECTDLVDWALGCAGAQPGVDYVWGTEIPGPPNIWGTWQRGDVIQFWDATFEWPENGGSTKWGVGETGRHTAIIMTAPLVNRRLDFDPWATLLIHQNDGVRWVTNRWVYLHYLVSGRFIVYRPVPRQ
jgi:hypothetical protein